MIAIGTDHITPEYTTCQEFPRAPFEILEGTGAFLGQDRSVIFCGGRNMNGGETFKECWSLNKDMTVNMHYDRKQASGVVIDEKVSTNNISYTYNFS